MELKQIKYLRDLENKSIYIIREAYKKISPLGFLWSIGKDSTVLLWLIRKAFFGHCPITLIHIDTSYKIPEMIRYRDKIVKEWGLKLIVGQNKKALKEGMGPEKGRLLCCQQLKTVPLQEIIEKYKFRGLIVGVRRDEESSRAKERYFSIRNYDSQWDIKSQPPEIWEQFNTEFPPNSHVRVHPLLHWREIDIWYYIKLENIPVISLYFAKNGKRYRSIGCAPCTSTIESTATTIEEIIEELKNTQLPERALRAQDQEDPHAMEQLRKKGYM